MSDTGLVFGLMDAARFTGHASATITKAIADGKLACRVIQRRGRTVTVFRQCDLRSWALARHIRKNELARRRSLVAEVQEQRRARRAK